MQTINVPALGARYWAAILLASVFGANLGDFVSHVLGLGHASGLPPLAILLAVVLLMERRSRTGTEAYYWLAIVIVRTAATNLGDLATHDFRLNYEWVIAGLAILLALVELTDRTLFQRPAAGRPIFPVADGRYWTAMLIAGTLGTAGGDFSADDLGLGVGPSAIVYLVVLAAVLASRMRASFRSKAFYWVAIVVIRTAGTNLGDYVAGDGGLNLGLPISTPLTGLLLLVMLMLWKQQPETRETEMHAGVA